MFSCCCADTASRGEIQIEENHEGVDGTQEHKGGDAAAAAAAPAAAAAAAPAAAAAESTEATPAAAAAPAPAAADAAANEHSVAAAVGRIKITPAKKDEAPAKKPMTAPKSDRARRTSVPLESPLEDGMFLM
ncbi:hypothetical protein, conserved [Eimeria maxima]|uniref:Uncharacterized protein n=1 Tax=Eimeria maxima TaxID=5804 RepID=U6MCJ9_EIMMA|nr:hypothetical protein, conserved [Eimeria maxima]CDJ61957.1 hypothetical protein, conserved [Eimeria maxima]